MYAWNCFQTRANPLVKCAMKQRTQCTLMCIKVGKQTNWFTANFTIWLQIEDCNLTNGCNQNTDRYHDDSQMRYSRQSCCDCICKWTRSPMYIYLTIGNNNYMTQVFKGAPFVLVVSMLTVPSFNQTRSLCGQLTNRTGQWNVINSLQPKWAKKTSTTSLSLCGSCF